MDTEDKSQAAPLGRDFWLFRVGQAVSVVGDSCGAIALAWWILDRTGSAVVMSSVLAPAMLARIVLTPLLGPLGDRFARKRLIAVSDLWRGGLTAILAVMAYQGRFALPAVIGVYILTAIGSAVYGPVSTSIIPQLVTSANLPLAFQQSQAIVSAGSVVGGLVGGTLVSLFGVSGAFAIDALSFFVGAASAQLVSAETRAGGGMGAPASMPHQSAAARWFHDLRNGFRFLYAVRLLFALALVAMLVNLVLAPLVVVLPVLVKESRGFPAWYLGALRSSMAVGAIVGAVLAGWCCRVLGTDRAIVLGIGVMGVAVAALPWLPGFVLPLAALLAIGATSSLANVPIMSQLTAATPDAFRGRVHSILLFLAQGSGPVGVALAGASVAVFGLGTTMTAMGVIALLAAPLLLAIPHLSEFFRRPPDEAAGYLASRYPGAFTDNTQTGVVA